VSGPIHGGSLAVVIAALDEAESITGVLEALPPTLEGLDVRPVVVDDGSTDGTADVAAAAGAIVVRHPRNLGQGEGLRTGFAVAKDLGADVVVTMDADGQHDPADLPALVGPVVRGEADYVQGSRFLGEYDDAHGARHLGIKIFTLLLNLVARLRITDCTNGYRAMRAERLHRLTLVEDRFSASEILIQAAVHGLRVREVPVHIRAREVGESRKPRGLRYPLGYLRVVLRSWVRARRSVREVVPERL
jgi:glycosyltransferase involved in cell wall biosynthesis